MTACQQHVVWQAHATSASQALSSFCWHMQHESRKQHTWLTGHVDRPHGAWAYDLILWTNCVAWQPQICTAATATTAHPHTYGTGRQLVSNPQPLHNRRCGTTPGASPWRPGSRRQTAGRRRRSCRRSRTSRLPSRSDVHLSCAQCLAVLYAWLPARHKPDMSAGQHCALHVAGICKHPFGQQFLNWT